VTIRFDCCGRFLFILKSAGINGWHTIGQARRGVHSASFGLKTGCGERLSLQRSAARNSAQFYKERTDVHDSVAASAWRLCSSADGNSAP
jgi:hypothetical protein